MEVKKKINIFIAAQPRDIKENKWKHMHGHSIFTQKLVQVFYLVITYNIHTVNDTKHTIYYDTSLAVTADAHAEAILILCMPTVHCSH